MNFALTIPGRPQRWVRPQQDGRRGNARNARFTDPKAEAHKRAVAKLAKAVWKSDPLTGPVVLTCRFVFAIPESWPKYVKEAARAGRVMHIQDPDLDQLVKQIMDALRGVVYVDDNQVVGLHQCAKRYGFPERTEIAIQAIEQPEDAVTPGQRALEKRQEELRYVR